jgi:hypothetical protein
VVKRKREEVVARTTRATSPASTNSSEESRGRSTVPKPVKANGDERTKKKSRASPDYSSSEGEAPRKRPAAKDIPRKAAASASTSSRKAAPPELKLNGHRGEPPDPEALRERYEELFPAYEQLSRKLAKLHRDAEAEEEGEVVEMNDKELAKMVARWEKWHAELEGIRRWFS